MDLIFQSQQTGKQATVTLDGRLTVERAEELRMLLIKSLIEADRVVLEFGSVTDVDLSCLQLICSAHRSASRMNKRLSFSGEWPDSFRRAASDAGYERSVGCHLDTDCTCLWTKDAG